MNSCGDPKDRPAAIDDTRVGHAASGATGQHPVVFNSRLGAIIL